MVKRNRARKSNRKKPDLRLWRKKKKNGCDDDAAGGGGAAGGDGEGVAGSDHVI